MKIPNIRRVFVEKHFLEIPCPRLLFLQVDFRKTSSSKHRCGEKYSNSLSYNLVIWIFSKETDKLNYIFIEEFSNCAVVLVAVAKTSAH